MIHLIKNTWSAKRVPAAVDGWIPAAIPELISYTTAKLSKQKFRKNFFLFFNGCKCIVVYLHHYEQNQFQYEEFSYKSMLPCSVGDMYSL